MASTLATTVLALDEEIASIDLKIADRFREHRDAEVIVSCQAWARCWGRSP
ncbi:hypothetical protein [Streptomyces sp. NPDC057557]|uniref:hypothetical protein n=1 Tax=Streptomyces sp. NPDC057557 TaxID=3346167 RepID=UPI0036AC9F93